MTSNGTQFSECNHLGKYATTKPGDEFRPRRYANELIENCAKKMSRKQRVAFQEKGGAGVIYKRMDRHSPHLLQGEFRKPYGPALCDYRHLRECDSIAGCEYTPHQPARTWVMRVAERLFPSIAADRAHKERWEAAYRLYALRMELEAEVFCAMMIVLRDHVPAEADEAMAA